MTSLQITVKCVTVSADQTSNSIGPFRGWHLGYSGWEHTILLRGTFNIVLSHCSGDAHATGCMWTRVDCMGYGPLSRPLAPRRDLC